MILVGCVEDDGERPVRTKRWVCDDMYAAYYQCRASSGVEKELQMRTGLNATWSLSQGWKWTLFVMAGRKCLNCDKTVSEERVAVDLSFMRLHLNRRTVNLHAVLSIHTNT